MSGGAISFTRGENPLYADKLNAAFSERVLVAGDTLTGPLILCRDPVQPFEAATKQYIDALATSSLTGFLHTTGGTMTGPLISSARISVSGAPITTDNTMLCHHLAAGITSMNVGGFVGSWNEVTGGYTGFYTDAAGNIVFGNADAGLGTVTGTRAAMNANGAMQVYGSLTTSGPVILPGDPASALQAATKQYVDAKTGFLPLAGGTITGDLTVQGAGLVANGLTVGIDAGGSGSIILNGVKQSPKAVYMRVGGKNRWITQCDAANETGSNAGSNFALSRYDDAGLLLGNAITIARVDGTTQFYAPVYLSGDPTAPTGAATKQYVDAHAGTGGIPDAPSDGKAYGRLNAAWAQVAPIASPVFTGLLTTTGDFICSNATVGNNTQNSPQLNVNGAASTTRLLGFLSGGVLRWRVQASNVAEGGSNAGSDFLIVRYSDAGASQGNALAITRSSGAIALNSPTVTISDPTNSSSTTLLSLQNTGTAGVGIQLVGNGATTPIKYINVVGGVFRIVNSAYNAAILQLTDAGALSTTAGITATTGNITASAGNVSASGGVSAGANILATGAVYGTTGVFADNTGNFGLFQAGNVYSMFLGGGGTSYRDTIDASTGLRSWLNWQSTTQMTLDVSGNLTILGGTAIKAGGGSWTAPSDARIKDVLDSYDTGLDAICKLRPVHYSYKNNTDEPGVEQHHSREPQHYIGLIAQATETAMPELVTQTTGWIDGEEVDDLRVLDPSALTFALINAVRELSARVVALEGV